MKKLLPDGGIDWQYEYHNVKVARIACAAVTLKGRTCRRFAEWEQEDGQQVCHIHRFWRPANAS